MCLYQRHRKMAIWFVFIRWWHTYMLNSRSAMKYMGLADVILAIKISRISDGLVSSQSLYKDKILEKVNNHDSDVARTPIDTSQHLSMNKGKSVSQAEYSRVIRSRMYLTSCTRLDIAYTVSKLSRYMSNLGADY